VIYCRLTTTSFYVAKGNCKVVCVSGDDAMKVRRRSCGNEIPRVINVRNDCYFNAPTNLSRQKQLSVPIGQAVGWAGRESKVEIMNS
jgi:hypothetical protein